MSDSINDLRHEVSKVLAEQAEQRAEQRQQAKTLERIANAVDTIAVHAVRVEQLSARTEDHETRIRTLERGWLKAIGAGAAVSALVSLGVIKLSGLV